MGALLIQGYVAFSPIPEERLEEEWAQFNIMRTDPAYRLPATTRPSHYVVSLSPYIENVPTGVTAELFTFDGEVTITIHAVEANVNEIVLHCEDLTISELTVYAANNQNVNLATPGQTYQCEMPWSFLRIPLTTTLNTDLQYIISSKFRGNLQTDMQGFYRSWYIDSTNQRR